MPYLDTIESGQINYDIRASALSELAGVDGVQFDGQSDVIHYGVSTTAAATAAKIANITGLILSAGTRVEIKFTNANTADNPSLNINSTGAKPIVSAGTNAVPTGAWAAGEIVQLIFDGTNYVVVDGGIASTTNYGAVKLDAAPTQGSTNAPTSGGVYAYTQQLNADMDKRVAAIEAFGFYVADGYLCQKISADEEE